MGLDVPRGIFTITLVRVKLDTRVEGPAETAVNEPLMLMATLPSSCLRCGSPSWTRMGRSLPNRFSGPQGSRWLGLPSPKGEGFATAHERL